MGKLVLHFTLSTHRVQDESKEENFGKFEVVAMYEPLVLRSSLFSSGFEFVNCKEDVWQKYLFISQLHDKAFELYQRRHFSQAAEAFAEALEWCESNPDMNISTKGANILKERCLEFAAQPPPEDWQFTSLGQKYLFISQLHDKAFELYRGRHFSQAAEAFAEALEWCESNPDMNVSPKAATILKERCLKFADHPPPEDWQFTSLEKYKEMKHVK